MLDDHLISQKFLAGNSLTAGDIPAGTSLYRYFEMGLEGTICPTSWPGTSGFWSAKHFAPTLPNRLTNYSGVWTFKTMKKLPPP